jgi:hypothetical protein
MRKPAPVLAPAQPSPKKPEEKPVVAPAAAMLPKDEH